MVRLRLNIWWLDSFSPEPQKFTGTLTDSGYEASGESPTGRISLKMEKTADGFSFKIKHGELEMKETYSKAK